jgi:hypothetical protein
MGFFHTGLRCRVATASLDLSRADQTQKYSVSVNARLRYQETHPGI